MAITDTIIDILRGVYSSSNSAIVTAPVGLLAVNYDAVAVTYPSATQEVYAFKTGGVSGTTVATITVNYSDSTKQQITNLAKS